MSLRPGIARLRALYLAFTASRIVYVILVDAALTFILFTYLYHYHLTTLTHSSTIVNLCRSLRLSNPSGLPIPFHSTCHASSTILNTPPTLVQRFLLVTRDIVIGLRGEGNLLGANGQGGRELYEQVRSERNWNVLRFVAFKILGLSIFFAAAIARSSQGGGEWVEPRGGITLEEEEEKAEAEADRRCVLVVVGSESVALPSSAVIAPPPAYTSSRDPHVQVEGTKMKEEEEEDEDDLPWVLLALSLIGHLSVVLFDQGAFERVIKSSLVGDKWVVIGFVLFVGGVTGISREMKRSVDCGRVESRLEESRDEKKGMIVIEL